MSQYKMIVVSEPTSPAEEDEYNRWYDEQHLHDVLKVDGIISAQRFNRAGPRPDSGVALNPYLAIYDIETNNLQKVVDELGTRAGTDSMPISSTLDGSSVGVSIYFARGPALVR